MTVPVRRVPPEAAASLALLDLAVGAVAFGASAAGATVRTLRLTPLLAITTRPFLRSGREVRQRLVREIDAVLPSLVTFAVERYVDLDGLVAGVDIDAIAARLDVDAVAARLDVEAVLDQLDLTTVVLERVDLERVVDQVLDRLDLTETVLTRVDLKIVAETVLGQLEIPALVEDVLDEIDLPEIIRESTGTMASDTVRSVRMQGVNGDEAITRAMDRLLRRRRALPGTSG